MSSLDLVAQANRVLGVLYESCDHNSRMLFGSDMLRGDDSSIIATTVFHRVLNKFQAPTNRGETLLKKQCSAQWVEYEDRLRKHDFYTFENCDRAVIYRARALLHKWFKNFKPSNDVEFTPGESFVSARGKTSVYRKLLHRQHWCVTHDACDDFIRLCYSNLSLKRCAKAKLRPLDRSQRKRLYKAFEGSKQIGFEIFRFRMLTEVITLVHGSRGSSVPKNNQKRRFINVEALGNMILQRTVAHSFRSVLSRVGNDLEVGQARHRELIRDSSLATIDFSNASDSVIREIVRLMFPKQVFDLLDRYRSPFVLIDGVYHEPVKMSSMGNGFTFELMSAMLLAIARTMDANASVYGDDVIILNQHAHAFIRATQAVGFNVNKTKTFIDSRFRESCGAFYLDGHGYITCYDIKWCQNIKDVITSCNKLFLIARDNPQLSAFQDAHDALISLIPSLYQGPYPSNGMGDLPPYAVNDKYLKKHMRDVSARRMHQLICDKAKESLECLCYTPRDFCVVKVPTFIPKLASPHIRDFSEGSVIAMSAALYAGGVVKDIIRNTGVWTDKLYIVTHSGILIPAKQLVSRSAS